MRGPFQFGIEEEYFLVDAETKGVATTIPTSFFEAAAKATGGLAKGELLQSQIEVATVPHIEMARARAELGFLREAVAEVAGEFGLAILASGTHPTALWAGQRQTPCERYDTVMHDLQMLGHRNILCGLHVHVELPDPDDRVDVMVRMLPYLPLFIALATSSPFWQSHRTGLMGYRLAAYDELPRTGVPELFTHAEFESYVKALARAGVIEDSSYVWWAIRPSLRHPTLELRAPDCCTQINDSIAIAALYRCLTGMLWRCPWMNREMTPVSRAIVVENKWRAQRYGIHGTFVDLVGTSAGAISVMDALDRAIEDSMHEAENLGCTAELMHCRKIVEEGTSADSQLGIFEKTHKRTADQGRALRAVTDWLAFTTLQ